MRWMALLALTMVLICPVFAQSGGGDEQTPLDRLEAAFLHADFETIASHCTPDCLFVTGDASGVLVEAERDDVLKIVTVRDAQLSALVAAYPSWRGHPRSVCSSGTAPPCALRGDVGYSAPLGDTIPLYAYVAGVVGDASAPRIALLVAYGEWDPNLIGDGLRHVRSWMMPRGPKPEFLGMQAPREWLLGENCMELSYDNCGQPRDGTLGPPMVGGSGTDKQAGDPILGSPGLRGDLTEWVGDGVALMHQLRLTEKDGTTYTTDQLVLLTKTDGEWRADSRHELFTERGKPFAQSDGEARPPSGEVRRGRRPNIPRPGAD